MAESVIVYTLTALLLAVLGVASVRLQTPPTVSPTPAKVLLSHLPLVAAVVLVALVAGFRYHTGYDHEMYLSQYWQMRLTGAFSRTDYEPGFVWISRLFAAMHAHYVVYFAFWAVLQAGLLYYGLRQRRHLLPWLGLNLMLGLFFVAWCNSIRQVVAECALVAMLPLAVERRWLPFLLLTLLLTMLHRSAVMLLPVYAVVALRVDRLNVRWQLLAVGVCIVLGQFPQPLASALLWIADHLPAVGYGKYSEMLYTLVADGFRSVPWGPVHVLTVAAEVAVVAMAPRLKQHFSNDRLLSALTAVVFVGICLENLLINTSHYMLRPVEYFTMPLLVLNAYVCSYLWQKRLRLPLAAFMLATMSLIYIDIYKAVYYPTPTVVPFLYHHAPLF